MFKKSDPPKLDTTVGGIPKNYDVNSLTEIEGFVGDSIERTRLEAERMFLNQHVVEMDQIFAARRAAAREPEEKKQGDGKIKTKYALPLDSFIENTFAKRMEEAVSSAGFGRVLEGLKSAVEEINEPSVSSIWGIVFALCQKVLLKEGESIAEFRNSKEWVRHVVEYGSKYLQEEYRRHMEAVISSNLEQAQRGGVPGTLPLIEAFLNVANLNYGKFMVSSLSPKLSSLCF